MLPEGLAFELDKWCWDGVGGHKMNSVWVLLSLRCLWDIQEQLSIQQFGNTDLESRRKMGARDANLRITMGGCECSRGMDGLSRGRM